MLNKTRLQIAMLEANINQTELANLIGVSKNTLSSRINGKSYFNTLEIDKICEVLNINSFEEKALIFLSNMSQKRDKQTA